MDDEIKKLKANRQGQITIFVIVAILIIAAFALIFLFRGKVIPKSGGAGEKNPQAFLQDCLEDKIFETSELISKQGGYTNPVLYKKLDNEKISYLCYTSNYYLSCINQEPTLIQHLKEEIKNNIKDNVKNCFDKFTANLEKAGYEVNAKYEDFDVELVPEKIIIDVDAKITASKNEQTINQKEFIIIFPSRIYELAVVAQEITSQEARFCNFEQIGFMILYPQFNIDKFRTGDGETIYTIEDRKTKEKFKFAVRGCVIPPGF